jgi:anti-sigma factor RsiW
MCDFPGRLVAWLDGEMPEGEAAEVQRHVQSCLECRSRIDAYERVSKGVNAYCDEAVTTKVHHGAVRWELVLSAAAVVGIVLLVAFPRARVEQTLAQQTLAQPTLTQQRVAAAPALHDAAAVGSAARVFETAPASENKIHRRRAAMPAPIQNTNWVAAEPGIQIAIPAEAMFPPGAVPDGINFVAEVSIAPDGSAQGLRLQPRLVGMESTTQP